MAILFNKPGSKLVMIKSLRSSAVKSAKFPFLANLLIASFDSGNFSSKRDGSGHIPILAIRLGCRNFLMVQNP
jgi:hypothetical protein